MRRTLRFWCSTPHRPERACAGGDVSRIDECDRPCRYQARRIGQGRRAGGSGRSLSSSDPCHRRRRRCRGFAGVRSQRICSIAFGHFRTEECPPSPSRPPPRSQAKQFTNARQAVAHVRGIYDANTGWLRERFQHMAAGQGAIGSLRRALSVCGDYCQQADHNRYAAWFRV